MIKCVDWGREASSTAYDEPGEDQVVLYLNELYHNECVTTSRRRMCSNEFLASESLL